MIDKIKNPDKKSGGKVMKAPKTKDEYDELDRRMKLMQKGSRGIKRIG